MLGETQEKFPSSQGMQEVQIKQKGIEVRTALVARI